MTPAGGPAGGAAGGGPTGGSAGAAHAGGTSAGGATGGPAGGAPAGGGPAGGAPGQLGSVGKALRILVLLGEGPASLDELAAALDVHKTTVLRLLRTLADDHFVHRDGAHRYHLGARLFELSSRGLDQREVRTIAAPHLAAFNAGHGRTTHLAELVGSEIVYIDKLESHDHVQMASRIGLRAPVHSTAAGKVLVADLAPAERDRVLAATGFAAATPNTITTRDGYLAELARVREQGWAHDAEENEPSINCIGAPVRGASGRVLAAVSVSVPDIVMSDDALLALVPSLLAVTEQISREHGWRSTKGHP